MVRSAIVSLALLLVFGAPLHAQDEPEPRSLAQRLAQLRKSWTEPAEEPLPEEIQMAARQQPAAMPVRQRPPHSIAANTPNPRSTTQRPANQHASRDAAGGLFSSDIFASLRSDSPETPSPRVASLAPSPEVGGVSPDIAPVMPSQQRAGSVLSGRAPQFRDIGEALAGPRPQPTPAPPRPEANPRRSTTARGDVALDLITSSADSTQTNSNSTPSGEDNREGEAGSSIEGNSQAQPSYATAADAARATSSPPLSAPAGDRYSDSPSDQITPIVEDYAQPPTATSRYPQESEFNSAAPVEPRTIDVGPSELAGPSLQSKAAFDEPPSAVITPGRDSGDWGPATSNPMRALTQPTPAGAARADANLLLTQQLPQIVSRVSGPSKILIGRESTYRVTIANAGSSTADTLVAEVSCPAWADVVRATSTTGAVRSSTPTASGNETSWEIPALPPGGTATLELSIVPKTSQPLELGVQWRQAPVASTTRVEVQEPKLNMTISGPDEIFFGRPQSYRLTVSNPGTGLAEKVVMQMTPPGGGQVVSTHRLESLAPGETKVVEVEITAREAGELAINAVAMADGGLRVDATHEVFCRKAELQIDWRGPTEKYAGTAATYFFRVRNPGTAPADQVEFEVNLPAGFEFSGGSEGQRYDAAGRRVTWKIGTLRPGDDCYLELHGTLNQPGGNELSLTATNLGGEIQQKGIARTEVLALADLKLHVVDPSGPVAAGSIAEYQIVVSNRGLSAAERVAIAGFFSAGIEPISVAGGEAQIGDGRVAFRTIDVLPAGDEVRLTIRARAPSAGTYLFRAEVLCSDSDIKLAAEETTRVFEDRSTGQTTDGGPYSTSRGSQFQQAR